MPAAPNLEVHKADPEIWSFPNSLYLFASGKEPRRENEWRIGITKAKIQNQSMEKMCAQDQV